MSLSKISTTNFELTKTLVSTLAHIGLTDKEARVYLACLETGSNIVSKIAKLSGLNRVTTYDILEKLKEKGFVSFLTKQKIKYFSAADPEIIFAETQRKTEGLRSIVPDLKRLKGETPHPRIQYFEGVEGIKTIYADTLLSKTEILNYANSQAIRDFWPDYDKEYVEKRAKKKIFLRGIAPDDEHGRAVHAEDKKSYREIRLVPAEKFDFTNEINIYDDKVAIASFTGELIGMIIESKEIANTQRAIFKMAWEFAGNSSKFKSQNSKVQLKS
ncbi:hypothetical protein HZA39_02665 [Candidatus Peregrinibacteria bacterium]|nr:hypothetical protein [Candidatus Peregrinibacteria bacterium]